MNTVFYYLFIYLVSVFLYYYIACEVVNLGTITSSIVVRVKSFESVHLDNWLDS